MAAELNAGRDLDARVAEVVMGWTNLVPMNNVHRFRGIPPSPYRSDSPAGTYRPQEVPPNYSTDHASSAMVIEKMLENFAAEFQLACNVLGEARARFTLFKRLVTSGWCLGATIPEAICLAALNALEAK